MKSLLRHGKEGYFVRGEVSLQRAMQTPLASDRWFDLAAANYQRASSDISFNHFSRSVAPSAEAIVRLGQLPLLKAVSVGKSFHDPSQLREQAKTAFENTVRVGMWLSHQIESPIRPDSQRLELSSERKSALAICNKFGLLALAQRFPIKEGVPEDWIVASALLSNTTDTDPGGISRRGKWDVSIWARRPGGRLKLNRPTHQIRLHNSEKPAYHENASTQSIVPLAMAKELDVYGIPERFIGSQILHDCWAEMQDPLHATQARRALNQQTELLLDVIHA